ncbi:cytochrome c oxidase assembly protein [Streptomyces prasinopilosus]|uniref:cytochrome c oxidase assembly protein n=1 Tax=Streptomyces prasinopilosus TaxID=67344 RepID=UPI00099ED356|nr:cytochrome c oxidase assembly protein [Streptomyces prasinopilosus]
MILAHVHPAAGPGLPGPWEQACAVAALLAAVAYAAAAGRLRRRGDAWSRWRGASFTAGSAGVAWAAVGPLPGGPFTVHMVQHLLLGMAAPLLLVLARPLTLVLRVLPPGAARRGLLSLARSRPAGWLVFPPLAALLDVGGLWLLYRTELFAAVQHRPLLHAVVHAHVLAAGLLFTFAVCQLDPVRRRRGLPLRGATLLAAGAAHAVLAKALYASPPPGAVLTTADLHTGAQVMYYGGDLVEAALGVVLAASWYRATGRARAHRRRRAGPVAGPRVVAGAPAGPGAAPPAAAGPKAAPGRSGTRAVGARPAVGRPGRDPSGSAEASRRLRSGEGADTARRSR